MEYIAVRVSHPYFHIKRDFSLPQLIVRPAFHPHINII